MHPPNQPWPAFSLTRLLRTVFAPKPGERIALLIDLPDPAQVRDFHFLRNPALEIQRLAHDLFYRPLKEGKLTELNLRGGDLFSYQITGGSNLDLPDHATTPEGRVLSFQNDV